MQYFYVLVVISQELTQNTVVLSHLIRKYKNNGTELYVGNLRNNGYLLKSPSIHFFICKM